MRDSGKYVEIKACCENDVYEVLVEGAPPEHELEQMKSQSRSLRQSAVTANKVIANYRQYQINSGQFQ